METQTVKVEKLKWQDDCKLGGGLTACLESESEKEEMVANGPILRDGFLAYSKSESKGK